jgi:RHS repeat-associated protein
MRLFTHKFSVLLFGMIISSFDMLAQSPTNTKNYVVTKSYTAKMEALAPNYLETDSRKVDISVMYMDGMGRPLQDIEVQASPSGKDIVQYHEYDNMSREARQYLPFSYTSAASNNGAFLGNAGGFTILNGKAVATGEVANFYNSGVSGVVKDTRPFSTTLFEASPTSRETSVYPVGEAFDAPKIITPNIRFNSFTNDKIYTITYSGSPLSNSTSGTQDLTKFTIGNYYADNRLMVSTIKDADAREGYQFTDMEGRLICKRIFMGSTPKPIDTYYVYDELSQLRCIVTPAAMESIPNGTTVPKTFQVLFGTSTKLYYFYDYDELGRVIVKETPKAGDAVEYIVYDQWDRIRCTQDGNQRINKKWSTVSYDKLNRPVHTAEVVYNPTATTNYTRFTALQTAVNAVTVRFEDDRTQLANSSSYNGQFYSFNKSLPTVLGINLNNILSVNYYDSYIFYKPGVANGDQLLSTVNTEFSSTYDNNVKGKLTGGRKKVLGSQNIWIRSVAYFDYDGNVIGSADDLYGIPNSPGGEVMDNTGLVTSFNGAYELTSTQYAWDGKAIRSNTEHRGVTAGGIKKVTNTFTYDHQSRLLKTTFSATGNAALDTGRVVTLANYEYNELGQVRRQTLGDNPNAPVGKQKFAQQFTYNYHIQGMVKEQLGQQFTEKTFYEKRKTDAALVYTGYFSGLVSESFWQSGGKPEQGQKFTYDMANRLTSTVGVNFPYAERGITYDNNGNILKLNRVWNNAVIDSLTYNYNASTTGSKIFLQSIIDDAPTLTRPQGVKTRTNLAGQTFEYDYDANGNLTKDGKKGITTAMTYNILDLMDQISINGKTVKYQYAADGEKLVTDMGTEKTVYAGAFEYDGSGVVVRVGTGVGQILREVVNTNAVYRYQYYLQDRLGNTRVVVNETGDTLQRSDYLAYGMQIQYGNNTKNKYLYEGKELQTEMAWFDFGARMYDPTIGRWHAPDPMNEFASPYDYVGGDPINEIDPDGMMTDGGGGGCCSTPVTGATGGNVIRPTNPSTGGNGGNSGGGNPSNIGLGLRAVVAVFDLYNILKDGGSQNFISPQAITAYQNTKDVVVGVGKGLGSVAKNLAPIQMSCPSCTDPSDPNSPKDPNYKPTTLKQDVNELIESLENLPTTIRDAPGKIGDHVSDVYANGSLEQKAEVTVSTIGTIVAILKGKAPKKGPASLVVMASSNGKTSYTAMLNLANGLRKEYKGMSGVYIHEFMSKNVYVGQAKDLFVRPQRSLKTLLKSGLTGDDVYKQTIFIPFKKKYSVSGLNKFEKKILKSKGGAKSPKTYNQNNVSSK